MINVDETQEFNGGQDLYTLYQDLHNQEEILRNLQVTNIENTKKRKWETLALKLRIAIPALFITGGVIVGAHQFGMGLPFVRDELKSYKRYTIESTYDGQMIEEEDESCISKDIEPKLVVYFPYRESNKGFTRKIVSFYLKNYNKEIIYEAIKHREYEFFLNSLDVVSEKEETVFYLPEDNSTKMVGVFSFLSNEYVCELPEPAKVNSMITILELFVIAFLNIIVSSNYIFGYKDKKKEIEENYPIESEEHLLEYINDIQNSIRDIEGDMRHGR